MEHQLFSSNIDYLVAQKDRFVPQMALDNMNEQQKMLYFGFNKMTEHQKHPLMKVQKAPKEPKSKAPKEPKSKAPKEPKSKNEKLSSSLLTQKAAGYLLAAANASKKGY
jgi:hypothetical protein